MTDTITLPQVEFNLLREVLSFFKNEPDKEIWLVGGSIRDLIASRRPLLDLDLAVSFNPVPDANRFARAKKAGFVVLDEERQVVRVVKNIGNGHYNIDFARFRAENIDLDLQARDFTINAMAAKIRFPLTQPQLTIYDPLNGLKHLKNKKIVACSDKLFEDDPLRIMRAFRFAALFNASFDEKLVSLIKTWNNLLKNVSGERIRDEFFKILNVKNSSCWLEKMNKNQVLDILLPELSKCKGVEQNEWHHLDVFDHSVFALQNFEKLLIDEYNFDWWPKFIHYLNEPISAGRNYKQALKLGCLIHDIGKPICKKMHSKDKRIVFHGHEMEGARLCRNIAERLKLSANEFQFLQKVAKNHMRPGVMLQQGITDRRLFNYFRETGRDGLGIALLSLADRMAALGDMSKDDLTDFKQGIFSLMGSFYEQMKRPKTPLLLKGSDLIEIFGLQPGPLFKKILSAIEESQFVGELKNREQAIKFVEERFVKNED
jgi:tRNA nucleotidyltransferase/poly(A) polymerase